MVYHLGMVAALEPPMQEALVVFFAWFLGGLPWGAIGIGGAIVFTLVYHLAGFLGLASFSPARVAVLILPGVLAMTGAQAIALSHSKAMNRAFALVVAITWTPFDVLGAWILFRAADAGFSALYNILGVCIFACFCSLLFVEWRQAGQLRNVIDFNMGQPQQMLYVIIFAVCGGFCSGFFSIPLVAFVLFPLLVGMSKDEWRSSVNPFYFFSTVVKTFFLWYWGRLVAAGPWVHVAGVGGALLGATLGNILAPHVSERRFRMALLLFLLVGSLSLMTTGTAATTSFAVVSAVVLVGAIGTAVVEAITKRSVDPKGSKDDHQDSIDCASPKGFKDRRLDPLLDGKSVTYAEMCSGLHDRGLGLSEAQLREHWNNIQKV